MGLGFNVLAYGLVSMFQWAWVSMSLPMGLFQCFNGLGFNVLAYGLVSMFQWACIPLSYPCLWACFNDKYRALTCQPLTTPCAHIACLDCTKSSPTCCPLPSCRTPYLMQAGLLKRVVALAFEACC